MLNIEQNTLKHKVKNSTEKDKIVMMNSVTVVNMLFLCLLNAAFMIAGIILNSLVITILWKSSQLRKKLCYFMVLVLSSFDLAVVCLTHPVLVFSTILWSTETYLAEGFKMTWAYVSIILGAFSMFTLLTLNIERFLAIVFPVFHRKSVTKKRLIFLLAFFMMDLILVTPVFFFAGKIIGNVIITVFLLIILFVFMYLNYKILVIAKLKSESKKVSPAFVDLPCHKKVKKLKLSLKNISTCSLAVACFFICSFPQIMYSVSRVISKKPYNDSQVVLFNIWSSTFVAMNSTFNCVIFFWRNSILRREGMKVLKCSVKP